MIKAGTLQHIIELQRATETVHSTGAVSTSWTTYATGKAELRRSGVSEFLTAYGEVSADKAVFVLRWLPGVSVADRVVHGGKVWNIVALAEIGRRRGLELRAVAS
ncbi:head-tail adaptor protein [Arenibacterium sp. LLYu02]|uniref:head-tail adaptor protein n=1 Tax=Arenibacterium sp. LLYu02 TaxID=3404132 RepID=UPI003B213CB7